MSFETVRQLRTVETVASTLSKYAFVSFERATPFGRCRYTSRPTTANSSGGDRFGSSAATSDAPGAAARKPTWSVSGSAFGNGFAVGTLASSAAVLVTTGT